MSCFSGSDTETGGRWCQKCDKCAYMYALFRGFNFNPETIGFTDNLFSEHNIHLYESFFTRSDDSHFYGSQGELGLAFYYSLKFKNDDAAQIRFRNELLNKFAESIKSIHAKYLGSHPTKQMPPSDHDKLMQIFSTELAECHIPQI
jgi:hypothetical protein